MSSGTRCTKPDGIPVLGEHYETESKLVAFIKSLYQSKRIFPQQCFSRGTFVFEDPGHVVFDLLFETKPVYAFWKTTHMLVKERGVESYRPAFDKFHSKRSIKEKEERWRNDKIYLFEREFETPLNGLCQLKSGCSLDDKKGVVFMYHFRIQKHEYTLMKLEGHKALSLEHTKRAVERYVLHTKIKNPELAAFPKRREDCQLDQKGCEHPRSDQHFRAADPTACDEYDKIARTGDEYFVPKSFWFSLVL